MIHLRIEDADYRLYDQWEDIPLSKAIEASKVAVPDTLIRLFELRVKDKTNEYLLAYDSLQDGDRIRILPEYYGRMIALFSDIPPEVIDRIYWEIRTGLFNRYLEHIVIGLFLVPTYQPKGPTEFEHRGVKYYLPNIEQMTAAEFAEAADMEVLGREVYGGRYEAMAMLIAILCRPKDEPYNESKVAQRAELFKDLPMSVAWEVYFFLQDCLQRLEGDILTYSNAAISQLQKQALSPELTNLAGMDPFLQWQERPTGSRR